MNMKKQFKRILEYIDDINIENARLLEVLNESINKRDKLIEENSRLREALRWHPVCEYPKRDEGFSESNISVNVLFRYNDKTRAFIVWYDRRTGYWVDPYVSKIIDINMITGKSKWCYIPYEISEV